MHQSKVSMNYFNLQNQRLRLWFVFGFIVISLSWLALRGAQAANGNWTTKANMPTARWAVGGAVINGKLYVVGGDKAALDLTNKLEVYDPATNTWDTKTDMPTTRRYPGAAAINGKLYVVGGGLAFGTYFNTLEVYDPATNQWTAKAGMPTARLQPSAVTINDKLYVVGGNNTANATALEVYDPATNTWETKAPLPTPRTSQAAAVIDGKIYVVGGAVSAVPAPIWQNVLEVYDPATNTWETKAAMPTARGNPAAVAINGLLYVVGGTNDAFGGSSLRTLEIYDPQTNTWRAETALMPTPRRALAAGVIGSRLYAAGGYEGIAFNTLEVYEPPPDVIANGSAIIAGACGSPTIAAIDPDETVTVNFTLRNRGPFDTGTLTATLQATGGVTAPSGPQNYDALSVGNSATRAFTFTGRGTCGDTLTATLNVTDGTNTWVVTFPFTLGGNATTVLSENFDNVTAPALPQFWLVTKSGPLPPSYTTTTNTPDTAPNAAFTNGVAAAATSTLLSRNIAIPAGATNIQVSFRHTFNFESTHDGAILQIQDAFGTFHEITDPAIGGSFAAGGYNGALTNAPGNPFAGRQAWTGTQSAYQTVTANFPAGVFAGQTIRLRWTASWDNTGVNADPNWRIDSVVVKAAVCATCCPTITGTVGGGGTFCDSANVTVTVSGGSAPYTVNLSNGATQTGNGPVFSFPVNPASTTTYTLAAGSVDANGCSITGNGSVIVTVHPSPSITLGINPTIPLGMVSANLPFTLTGGSPNQYSINYDTTAEAAGFADVTNAVLSGPSIGLTVPTTTTATTYNATLTVRNSATGCISASMPFSVSLICPSFTVGTPSSTAAIGQSYSSSAAASPAAPGGFSYRYSLANGTTLPAGLALGANTGTITGTPTAIGNFTFDLKAELFNNSNASTGCSDTQTRSLNVACGSITVNPAKLLNGLTFVSYTETLSATGGSGTYTFSLVSGTLPAGLSLNGNVLSGTPTTAGASSFTIRADDDANTCFGEQAYTINIGSTGLMYYPLARPVRLLDTRPGASPNACFQPNAPIAGGTSRVQVARGTCEGITIPANATTITGHITTVQSGGGFLTLYPSDVPQPQVTNSNYLANEVLNNAFTVGIGASDGAFKLFVSSDTDVVIDMTGYYAPPTTGGLYFHPLPKPIRLLETRTGFTGCQTPGTPLQTGTTRLQTGVLTCDGVIIPTGAQALVGNATTTNSTGNGYLTLYPGDATQPFASSSNFAAGINRNAPFTVGLSLNGEFNIYTARTTDLVIDVMGYYSTQETDVNGQGLLFNSLGSPLRLLDTRAGQSACYQPGAPMTGGTVYTQDTQIPCTNLTSAARALVGNVSALNATANGFVTFWPSNTVQPTVATSNYQTGRVFNRHFTVGLGTDAAFKRFTASTTDVIIDISGFFAP